MGFTYKSSNVQAPDLYDPIDDNILLQGQKAIYDRTMAFAEEANKYKSAFFGQNAYGKDAEILKQKEAEYNAAISEVTKGGIESMEAQTAINAIINQASSDKDILGISQRTSAYERELKNKQEAEAKGEGFSSPLLQQAENYYSSGKYYTDERFNGSGWLTPNEAKSMKSAKELVEKKKGWKENPDGTREEYEYYDPEDLKVALQQVYKSNPNYEKEFDFQFKNQTKDVNWDDYAKQENATLVQEAKNNMDLAATLYNSAKDETTKQKALERYTEAQKTYSLYSDAYNNPSSSEEVRQNYYNDFKNRKLQMSISAMDAEQRKPIAMNEIKKAQMDLKNDIVKDREKQILELEIASGISRNTPDFFKVASTKVQTDKQTNAKLANPNYKVVASDVIDDWTKEEWDKYVFQNDKGKVKIADNDNAKEKLIALIQKNPEDYQDIPEEIINSLSVEKIDIIDGGIEIDQGWKDFSPLPINSRRLMETRNKTLKKNEETTQPNKVGAPNNNTVTPVTDSLANQGTPRGRNPR